jgi:septum site-determining protein MinC
MNASALPDYSQAGELKFGQVGIANLRLREWNVARLAAEMTERVQRAPRLFARAAVVLDFGGLAACPNEADTRELIRALREAGVHPVALAYGTRETEQLAQALELPLLAKFRASYEREPVADPPLAASPPEPAMRAEAEPESRPAVAPGLVHVAPVRSGQQVYAQSRDLTVFGLVGAGAEVMADGSIHVHGPLRGRALAGAAGETSARIVCREFHAELVAIAGHYRVLEDVPATLVGQSVQVWLDGEQLRIEALD